MNLESIINLLLSNPQNIDIKYSNNNGVESLSINGEEVKLSEDFDDSEVKNLIADYKERIELLDDDIFLEAMEEVSESIDMSEMDDLMNKEHLTKDEALVVTDNLLFMRKTILDHLDNKIDELVKNRENFF